MKIILAACNAKYIHSNLAVYDLQAYARQYQQHILLKEYTINQQKDEIMKDLYEERVPLYEKYADVVVDEKGRDLEECLQLLLEKLDTEVEG